MTFQELQDAVLEKFSSDQRPNAMQWINLVYAQLWTAEPWTFRLVEDTPTTSAGTAAMSGVPSYLGRVKGLWNEEGVPMKALAPSKFNSLFLADGTATGQPWSFKVVNSEIKLGPTPSAAETYTLLHQRKITALSADGDEPLIPEEYHWLLVVGAQGQGQVIFQDPNAGMSIQTFASGTDLLRRDYLEAADVADQWGRAS